MSRSVQLKEEGNRHFQAGDYVSAEALYSKAIIADPRNPALYTNRAMARLKLSMWENTIADCEECLQLAPDNMKAHYYLAQAHLELHNYEEALAHAKQAHALCVASGDKSLSAITAVVLRCKKERWEALERRRIREALDLEGETLDLLQRARDQALDDAMDDGEKREIAEEWEAKISQTARIFEKARAAESKRRAVPEWAIDEISFCVMVDPVVTKTGKSYERASILEHLRRSQTDPVTREPLFATDLRPNLALKEACEEFLDENGWAADW